MLLDRKNVYDEILKLLPHRIASELSHIALSFRELHSEISEIRLSVGGLCSIVIKGRRYPMFSRMDREEAEALICRLSEGALYAYREEINQGYISLFHGVRVGVGGRASYDGASTRGVSDISSLIFRLPFGECDFLDELYERWLEGDGGMLIIAPPAGGKTTALRSLCKRIGSGRDARAVVVVDERMEFDAVDYSNTMVTLLRGYRRKEGLELALRTMSCEVLVVDELISCSDALSLSSVVGSGVRLLASTHGGDCEGVRGRAQLDRLVRIGAFSTLVALGCENGRFFIKEVRAC